MCARTSKLAPVGDYFLMSHFPLFSPLKADLGTNKIAQEENKNIPHRDPKNPFIILFTHINSQKKLAKVHTKGPKSLT